LWMSANAWRQPAGSSPHQPADAGRSPSQCGSSSGRVACYSRRDTGDGVAGTNRVEEMETAQTEARDPSAQTPQPVVAGWLRLTGRQIGAKNEEQQERQIPQDVHAALIGVPELDAQEDGGGEREHMAEVLGRGPERRRAHEGH